MFYINNVVQSENIESKVQSLLLNISLYELSFVIILYVLGFLSDRLTDR